jgi:hypothetical protein
VRHISNGKPANEDNSNRRFDEASAISAEKWPGNDANHSYTRGCCFDCGCNHHLGSRGSSIELSTAAMAPLQELHAMVGVNKLPTQEIEDLSVGFLRVEKR